MATSIVSNNTAATFGNSPQKTGEALDHATLLSGKALEFDGISDYIAFTDMGSKKKCAVHFLEVKSGESTLNSRQRNIKDAIQKGRVYWHEYNADGIWTHETRDQHLNKEKNG